MRRIKVPLPGVVSVGARDFFGGPAGSTVGGTGLWDDASDATYAELYVTCHPDASLSDTASSTFAATPLDPMPVDRVTVLARLRAQAITATGAEKPLGVDLEVPGGRISRSNATEAPTGTTAWHEIVMPFAGQLEFDEFRLRVNEGTLDILAYMGVNQAVTDFTYPGVRIYEAHLLIQAPGGYAPPCRNIKRGDRLDLGGARNYPPSKMTQTSSRGVGAY